MGLHSRQLEPPRRHDLVFLSRDGWRSALASRKDLVVDRLVSLWVDNGWPLVARRRLPGEWDGVALGLPAPPWAGKRRISLLVEMEDVLAVAAPPTLRAVTELAPRAWHPTLERLERFAARNAVEVRVFGSLSWRALTGLGYLGPRSDLDVLIYVHPETDIDWLTAGLAEIEAMAPMRLDGELVRGDGAAVNWRELHAGTNDVLVKTLDRVELLDAKLFLPEPVLS